MAINVSVQYNGGFLTNIVLLTLCYYQQGTRLNAKKRFCIYSLCSHLPVKCFDDFPPCLWRMLRRFRCVQIFIEVRRMIPDTRKTSLIF